jgi:hypothetical protein
MSIKKVFTGRGRDRGDIPGQDRVAIQLIASVSEPHTSLSTQIPGFADFEINYKRE